MFAMQCRKNITVEDNQKRVNIVNFIDMYTNICTYIICDKNDQNKSDSINSIHQYCCVVFPTSGFPYLILRPRQYKWKLATTYLAIKTKNN